MLVEFGNLISTTTGLIGDVIEVLQGAVVIETAFDDIVEVPEDEIDRVVA